MVSHISRTMGPVEWLLLLFLSVIWGGAFFFFAIAVKELPTFTIVLFRVMIGTLALWMLVMAMGIAIPRDLPTWRNFLILGLLNNAIPFCLIVWGQHEVAPGLAAILTATTPFFTVLAAHALTDDEPISWMRACGALAGLGGVALMVGIDVIAAGGPLLFQLSIVLAAVSYALGSVFGRRFFKLPPLVTAAGQTSGASLILLPLALLFDRPWTLPVPSAAVCLAILALALLCTALAYVIFFTVLKRAGAVNIGLVAFLVPASAILLGTTFLDERLGLQHVAGMVAIGLGLALIDGRLPGLFRRVRATP